MPFLSPVTERTSVVDVLHPVSKSAAAYNGNAIDMLYFHRCLFLLDVGVVSSGGTVDFKCQASADGSTGWTDLSGKAITQITASNKVAKVGIQAEDLASANSTFRYIRYVLTIGTAASLVQISAIGVVGRFKPENKQNEVAAVTQTIADAN